MAKIVRQMIRLNSQETVSIFLNRETRLFVVDVIQEVEGEVYGNEFVRITVPNDSWNIAADLALNSIIGRI